MRVRFWDPSRPGAGRVLLLAAAVVMVGSGCAGPGGMGGGGWFKSTRPGGERWTVRCLRSTAPNHAELCDRLAENLRRAEGLRAEAVQVRTDAAGSTIYYGEYVKVPSSTGAALAFPPQMQHDINVIRGLVVHQQMPFSFAVPEPVDAARSGGNGRWHVSTAKGTHTLLIAVFYNTPTFDKRKEAAEQYVELLRNDGYSAYLLHEPVKSFVFVGDFEQSDLVQTPDGQFWHGPRVEELIAGRPNDEFRYLTDNGFRRKYQGPGGQMLPVPSRLVPVPRGGGSRLWGF